MHKYLVSRPYAYAILMVAIDDNTISKWQVFLRDVAEICANKDSKLVLANPQISVDEKLELFKVVLEDRSLEKGIIFLSLLLQNARLQYIPHIYKLYKMCVYEFNNKMVIKVITVHPLSLEMKGKLESSLLRKYHLDALDIEYRIDPDIIGGIMIKTKYEIIDGSIIKRLDNLKKLITV